MSLTSSLMWRLAGSADLDWFLEKLSFSILYQRKKFKSGPAGLYECSKNLSLGICSMTRGRYIEPRIGNEIVSHPVKGTEMDGNHH